MLIAVDSEPARASYSLLPVAYLNGQSITSPNPSGLHTFAPGNLLLQVPCISGFKRPTDKRLSHNLRLHENAQLLAEFG